MVYFIVPKEISGRVKIGYAKTSAFARLRELQTGSPVKLKLWRVWLNGSINDEQELHSEYRKIRLHGEWFQLTDELRKHIMMLSILNPGGTPFNFEAIGHTLDEVLALPENKRIEVYEKLKLTEFFTSEKYKKFGNSYSPAYNQWSLPTGQEVQKFLF